MFLDDAVDDARGHRAKGHESAVVKACDAAQRRNENFSVTGFEQGPDAIVRQALACSINRLATILPSGQSSGGANPDASVSRGQNGRRHDRRRPGTWESRDRQLSKTVEPFVRADPYIS